MGSNIGPLLYATAAFFLRWLRRNILLIFLLLSRRNSRLRVSALGKVASNQLIRPRPQGRLK
jgi:hypothetical protein